MGMLVGAAWGWACPSDCAADGHVLLRRLGEGMSTGAARRGRRDCLGGHHQPEGNDDVGPPGPDGALPGGAGHQLAQGIRQAAINPVAHHHSGPQRGVGEELLRLGDR